MFGDVLFIARVHFLWLHDIGQQLAALVVDVDLCQVQDFLLHGLWELLHFHPQSNIGFDGSLPFDIVNVADTIDPHPEIARHIDDGSFFLKSVDEDLIDPSIFFSLFHSGLGSDFPESSIGLSLFLLGGGGIEEHG